MKNYLLFGIAIIAMSSCNRAELAQSNHDRDSLSSIVMEREAAINDFIASFNDVERNLDSVALRQHIIAVNSDKPGELKINQKARINAEIASINYLMDQNRHNKLLLSKDNKRN